MDKLIYLKWFEIGNKSHKRETSNLSIKYDVIKGSKADI